MSDPMIHLMQAVKVSAEIHDLKETLESLPIKVREVSEELQSIQGEYEKKKVSSDELDKEKHRLENELKEESSHLGGKEERLNSIKTQKEYQAVVREIATAKTLNKEREEKIKKLTEDLDSFEAELAPLESKVQDLQKQLGSEQSQIQGTLDEMSAKIKKLEKVLEEQLAALPDDIRSKYRKVEAKRQPPAARVVDGTCQECFMSLPPQQYIELLKKHKVQSCPNCHRLLYLEEEGAA